MILIYILLSIIILILSARLIMDHQTKFEDMLISFFGTILAPIFGPIMRSRNKEIVDKFSAGSGGKITAKDIDVLKSFSDEDRDLINTWSEGGFQASDFLEIQRQISEFRDYEKGIIDPAYLNSEDVYSKLYYIKSDKILALKKKLKK